MNKILFWGLIIISLIIPVKTACFIFTPTEEDSWASDKAWHCFAHLGFTSYICLADKSEWPTEQYSQLLSYAFMSSVVFGITYETTSGFYPLINDGFSVRDFISDVGGSFIGVGIMLVYRKPESHFLQQITTEYRKNNWLRFGVNGIISGAHYAMEKTIEPPGVISDKDLFCYTFFATTIPDISWTANQLLFFPKKENIHWQNTVFDIVGSLVGVAIASQFSAYNPKIAEKITPTWNSHL
ncbi:MAG: hypothetical protein PHE59_03760 [Patescibacteria group bacterium]|nr:hypothetical protein [Patescibacteria group bacterium]MDD5164765.1 hypothetical protein [Patescibacteria group bacterium]MDD5534419.1 hypothetical protein [Patescibacteria group bacterium]